MDNSNEMRVTKRNGELQDVSFDKILERVKKLGQEANIHINYSSLVMKVIDQLYDKMPTAKIKNSAASIAIATVLPSIMSTGPDGLFITIFVKAFPSS